ncbi:hypothetical protein [Microvirga tunisiensis]|uniref:Uncharacterized protein n=1 Tax=Microvirga tunisiensis TaxID=2108360 RepID=A0A5N7MH98_9HYPH|nr:hypothetical protein [Microvirga tunisiensis]MPR07492.1 hypothetical protein [Microvirga tunisiensis]MPR25759.1 hypothetical protein [Microvirga tunisiensis]
MPHTTYVIEVGDVTAGIDVAVEGSFRFFTAGLAFGLATWRSLPQSRTPAGRHVNNSASVAEQPCEVSTSTKALPVTVVAVATALFVLAFRLQASDERSHVTTEWLEKTLDDPRPRIIEVSAEPVGHHLLQITQAQDARALLSHTQQDHQAVKTALFERHSPPGTAGGE